MTNLALIQQHSKDCRDPRTEKRLGRKVISPWIPEKGSGAGWVDKWIPMEKLLAFVNRQAAAIKSIEGNEILVTASGWSEKEIRALRTTSEILISYL